MDTQEVEYLKELKKNIKLKRQTEVLNKIKNKGNIREEINKKIQIEIKYIKENIEKWTKGGYSKEIYKILKKVIKINPLIQGSGLAFDKNIYQSTDGTVYYEDYNLFAPFVYYDGKKFFERDIANYDYVTTGIEWWETPKNTLKPYVTQPYLGRMSNTNTISHSFPIVVNNKFYGIFFYDVSWDYLNFICGFT